MFAQRAHSLILELQRSDGLPAYNDELVRGSIQETNDHYGEMHNIMNAASGDANHVPNSIPKEAQPILLLHETAMKRNKRCLMAYHKFRLDKLKSLRWETTVLPQNLKTKLSSSEVEFFASYDKLMVEFGLSTNIDIMLDQQPPEELFIEIRVVKECGEIVTDSGTMISDVGTTHNVRRADVEHLVRQGLVEQLSSEEVSS